MLKGMFLSVERRGQDWRWAKNVYTFGACEKRGQSGADSRKDWGSRQDCVAKIAGQSIAAAGKTDEAGKTAWRR